jgi:AraC-like DNA-binding protein
LDCTGFRISFGESPHSYLLRLRIERSLVLLKDTDLSLWRVDGVALTRWDITGVAVALTGMGIIVWGGWRP